MGAGKVSNGRGERIIFKRILIITPKNCIHDMICKTCLSLN